MLQSDATLPNRSRGLSTSFTQEQQRLVADIEPLLKQISDPIVSCAEVVVRLPVLHQLRSSLKQYPDVQWQEVIRLLGGFDTLLLALDHVAGYYRLEESEESRTYLFEYLKCILSLLSDSLAGHVGNERFFCRKIGYTALEQRLTGTGLSAIAPDHLFGLLFAFGLSDETFATFIARSRRDIPDDEAKRPLHIRERTRSAFSRLDLLRHPAILPLIVRYYHSLAVDEVTAISVLQAILSITLSSQHNLIQVHSSGIFSSLILPSLWPVKTTDQLQAILREIGYQLIELGVNSCHDAKYLYRRAIDDDDAADFLLHGLRKSRTPPHVLFDLSHHGFASIELSALGRQFPPSASTGYTLALWVRIEKFDDSIHTTLFGVFDSSQKCFLLAYLEQESHKLILQTSLSSTKASIRFRNFIFHEAAWYHIAIVHRRGKATTAARALLYINGEFVEQSKCTYPQCPQNASTPVQAFLGTPADLSPRIGHGILSSRWSLASAYLFDDVLSDDLISVHYNLSPRYYGNFQDCLGSFQTYEASAALNMRNELLHPGREEKSDIISAIRQKASVVMSETRVLLNISAFRIITEPNQRDWETMSRVLTRQSLRNLQSFVRRGPTVLNGALPLLNDALCSLHGTAIMTGEPGLFLPGSLDDAAWKIGGAAAVTLKLVETAKTPKQVCKAVQILFETIKENWRNSEAMEKENGFGILAYLLKTMDFEGVVSQELLDLILIFVGYNPKHPEESILINPLAYRVLLVDFDLWRKADINTQKSYFSQFIVFGSGSINHRFNVKRLLRMRIIKKLLHALKSDAFSIEVLPSFMAALKSLVGANFSAETLRSLSLFITYALHSGSGFRPIRHRGSNVHLRKNGGSPKRPSSSSSQVKKYEEKPLKRQVGVLMLEMYSELLCEASSISNVTKFARTVTNKWLLYLLDDSDPTVVISAMRILARILVVHGQTYIGKFGGKSGGFVVLKRRLRRWWKLPEIWMSCLCVLLGVDISKADRTQDLTLYHLLSTLHKDDKDGSICAEIWPVIATILQSAVTDLINSKISVSDNKSPFMKAHGRRRSLSLDTQKDLMEIDSVKSLPSKSEIELQTMIQAIVNFLADLQQNYPPWKEFCSNTIFLKEMLAILFPIICDSEQLSAETELDLTLAEDAKDKLHIGQYPVQEDSLLGQLGLANNDTAAVSEANTQPKRAIPFRRGSSYVIVERTGSRTLSPSLQLIPVVDILVEDRNAVERPKGNLHLISSMVDVVVSAFLTVLTEKREFSGFGMATKIPPGTLEQRVCFESYMMRNTLVQLRNDIALNPKLLLEPRVLTNIGRLAYHLSLSVFEGWFATGVSLLLELIAYVLHHLARPEVASLKSIQLCNQTIVNMRLIFHKLLYQQFSVLSVNPAGKASMSDFLQQVLLWHDLIVPAETTDINHVRLLTYFLYLSLTDNVGKHQTLALQDDIKAFEWIALNRTELNALFVGTLAPYWDLYVGEENKRVRDSARAKSSLRKDKLKSWILEKVNDDEIYNTYTLAYDHWTNNIFASEHLKYQRAVQDHHDNVTFMVSAYAKLNRGLHRPFALLDEGKAQRWRLDMAEGRNRMRMRLLPDYSLVNREYTPKRRTTDLLLNDGTNQPRTQSAVDENILSRTQTPDTKQLDDNFKERIKETNIEDDFEMVDDPKYEDEEYEDKNRKVLRSLQHGEIVQHVTNVSRVVGLSVCEGLLILGKENLYMIDHFFQRSDGEIVNIWQASNEERDQYLQTITGFDPDQVKPVSVEHETRQWLWRELLSVSKRKFLFRDVALELFFSDGRNYLLTTLTVKDRDTIHSKLAGRISTTQSQLSVRHNEEAWLVETMGHPATGMSPISFGGKLANVFLNSTSNPATKKWLKHEISNFHYLILVNAMAGRTFNDLTQYPVFPWVLADYTSLELDLTNPKTFRDFSKPMGAQSPQRCKEFQDRYRAFKDLGDSDAPPFHYGTHYSSAMIVCSYLIRMQPFVNSYLLLQGGNFDHADRLFYSLEKAWTSASHDTTTDVRELIPEFFYLPEFLVNSNSFNFGTRQATGEAVDSVILPPWAKDDPKIFIAKHREALESPYVSEHLHDWIDLIFGYKQRGEAAIEATNVFHYLSYSGAVDLGSIADPVERTAAIGIIHNFGQTPHQIFTRSHPQRENHLRNTTRLDGSVESLVRLPFPLLDMRERIHSLIFSTKHGKVFPSTEYKVYVGPLFDKFLEWGFFDGGTRLYDAENKRLALFEHLHIDEISVVQVVDEQTLITGGNDCTVSIWKMECNKTFDIHPVACLQGHITPVSHLNVSHSFNILITCSQDGIIFVWDLSRRTYIRKLGNQAVVQCIAVNDVSGDILVCGYSDMTLYTINGEVILHKYLEGDFTDQAVISAAFYEGLGNEWLERDLLFTGHKRGIVNIWSKQIRDGKFDLILVKTLQHVNQYQTHATVSASITAVLPTPRSLFTGDEWGRVYQWDCVAKIS